MLSIHTCMSVKVCVIQNSTREKQHMLDSKVKNYSGSHYCLLELDVSE